MQGIRDGQGNWSEEMSDLKPAAGCHPAVSDLPHIARPLRKLTEHTCFLILHNLSTTNVAYSSDLAIAIRRFKY